MTLVYIIISMVAADSYLNDGDTCGSLHQSPAATTAGLLADPYFLLSLPVGTVQEIPMNKFVWLMGDDHPPPSQPSDNVMQHRRGADETRDRILPVPNDQPV